MLNPSTADADTDDPTIRRVRGFGRRWGCDGVGVWNLYGFRSPNPKALWKADDPVGPDNDTWFKRLFQNEDIVCAWGNNAKKARVKEFVDMAKARDVGMWCLGVTKSGAPRHPLYVRADQPLIKWPQ